MLDQAVWQDDIKCGWRDRQDVADRLDPMRIMIGIDQTHHRFEPWSSSASAT